MSGDNDKNKKGFSGLADLASDVSQCDGGSTDPNALLKKQLTDSTEKPSKSQSVIELIGRETEEEKRKRIDDVVNALAEKFEKIADHDHGRNDDVKGKYENESHHSRSCGNGKCVGFIEKNGRCNLCGLTYEEGVEKGKGSVSPRPIGTVGSRKIDWSSVGQWIFGICVIVWLIWLVNNGGQSTKQSSYNTPHLSQSYNTPQSTSANATTPNMSQSPSLSPDASASEAPNRPSIQYTREAQRLLTELGYEPGPVDGQYGRRTADAVKAFQKDFALTQDGWIDQSLLNSLENFLNSRKKAKTDIKAPDAANEDLSSKRRVQHSTTGEYTSSPTPQGVWEWEPTYPEQPLPHTGSVRTFTAEERIAPFEIKAAQGSHYLLKLVDAYTHASILTVFVRSGTTVNVDVPLGTYEVRYASGTSWYGYKHFFGPDTAYNKADTRFTFKMLGNQVRGFTITLYQVAHGNLHTSAIGPMDF
jgi:peptidoglycan hydrolase-like protein with peptidoglycan-binding domain